MRTSYLVVPALCLVLASACGDGGATDPVSDDAPAMKAAGASAAPFRVTVLTQNMYPGTNLDLVVAALASPDPADDLPALAVAIQTLQETDISARAALLADEIARVRPHAVGLQEVSTFQIAAAVAGQEIDLDFLSILQGALAARGLNYVAAGAGTNYALAPVPGIFFSQGDALLIDADRVSLTSAEHNVFNANIGPVAPGIELRQGWSVADASVAGRRVIFVSTHPEADLFGTSLSSLRAAQVGELVGTLPAGVPVVLMGDLNDAQGSPMYQILTGAGMTDLWRDFRPGVAGNTCCHEDNLADKVARFDQRIDYVFARGLDDGAAGTQGKIGLFGDQPSERIAGPLHPLWASDHAALVATVLQPPGGRD